MGGEDKRPTTTRRVFLRGTATVVPAVATGGASLMTADAAWAAVHGEALFTYIGKTADRLKFAARWMPKALRKQARGGV